MTTDPQALKRHLVDLHLKLRRFDENLRKNFTTLDSAWQKLDRAWDGYAYKEFKEHWQKTRQVMIQYNEMSKKYETFLLERVRAIDELEKGHLR
jgi:uncharacterized protein YukE